MFSENYSDNGGIKCSINNENMHMLLLIILQADMSKNQARRFCNAVLDENGLCGLWDIDIPLLVCFQSVFRFNFCGPYLIKKTLVMFQTLNLISCVHRRVKKGEVDITDLEPSTMLSLITHCAVSGC